MGYYLFVKRIDSKILFCMVWCDLKPSDAFTMVIIFWLELITYQKEKKFHEKISLSITDTKMEILDSLVNH